MRVCLCRYCKKEFQSKYLKIFCSFDCKHSEMMTQRDLKGHEILKGCNTPAFCYLIGLIVTDGNIRGTRCRVGLLKSDRKLLEALVERFGGRVFDTCGKSSFWYLHNRNFTAYLKTLGLTENKMYTLNTPLLSSWFISLPASQRRAFILGVVDGDGSITFSIHNKRKYVGFQLCIECASRPLLEMIKNFLKVGNIYERPLGSYSNQTVPLYKYSVGGSNVINVLTDVYTATPLFLERKFWTFQKLLRVEEATVRRGLSRKLEYVADFIV